MPGITYKMSELWAWEEWEDPGRDLGREVRGQDVRDSYREAVSVRRPERLLHVVERTRLRGRREHTQLVSVYKRRRWRSTDNSCFSCCTGIAGWARYCGLRGNAVGVLDGQHHPLLEQPCLTEHEASTGSAVCTSVGPRFNGAHVFGLGDVGGGFHLGLGDVGACSTNRESPGQRGSKGARGHGGRAGYGRGGGGRAGAAWAGPTCSAKVEAGEKASTICPSYLAFRCLDSCLCRTHTGGSSVDTGGESSSGESSGGEGTPDLPIDCAREPQRRKSPFELNRK